MPACRRLLALGQVLLLAWWAVLALGTPAAAQDRPTHIAARLMGEPPLVAGGPVTAAIAFRPEAGWHGYWSNPGDAGYGMALKWELPPGWTAREPRYPVPQTLVVGGLMNHVYEGPYAVLVDLVPPAGAKAADFSGVRLKAQWLACTDTICVPEQATLAMDPAGANRAAFDGWRAAIPAPLDRAGTFALTGAALRVAIPLPASLPVPAPHLFTDQTDLVRYAAPQVFRRVGDMLVGEVPLAESASRPGAVSGILALGNGDGLRFTANPGAVPSGGGLVGDSAGADADTPLYLLLLAALAGGLLLNVMPCVFPILSLKALSLARSGESDAKARSEGLAYTGGVLVATLALGALLLGLRAAGESVGWAFQLQEPAVVVLLLVLAAAITANLAGLFELPGLSVNRGGERAGAFATGLLAAFVATPCTGPFMAAAMGAALLLPWAQGMLLFAMLGLGLALPFLALGFVPPLRRMLPRPGPWMETFRRVLAVPMGITALALLWLCWRLGGPWFAGGAALVAVIAVGICAQVGRRQRAGSAGAWWPVLLPLAGTAVFAALALPRIFAPHGVAAETGGIIAAQPFTEARLAAARAGGKPAFVWFTADWCLTCKVNEAAAIEREATRAAFDKAGVTALVGDWTRRDPAITRFLTKHGAAGVPLYLWYPAGGGAPQVLPQVLGPDSLVTLSAAVPAGAPRRADR